MTPIQRQITLESFCHKWLPATQHSSDFSVLMELKIAYPFEYGCYESWGLALKVKLYPKNLSTYSETGKGLETPVDKLNGWESSWCYNLEELDKELEKRFELLNGRKYEIGDNCYLEMRAAIKHPDPPK